MREKVVISDLKVNNNGDRFHNFYDSHCLSVLNTWFTHKRCRRTTWHSPDGVTKKVYDFILSCSWIRQYVTNCRVYNSYDFDSDHRLVIAHLSTPCSKASRFVPRSYQQKKKKEQLDVKSLNDPVIHTNFINAAAEHLSVIDLEADNSSINSQFVNAINTAATETLSKKSRTRFSQPWQNDTILKELYDERDSQRKNNASSKTINTSTKRIRKRARFLRDEHFKAEATKINQYAINRELDKLFAKAKQQKTTLRAVPDGCPPEKIVKHFKAHFNPDDPSLNFNPDELGDDLPEFVEELQNISRRCAINDDPPTIEEIQTHLNALKTKKASNDIDPEILKRCEHPIMLEVIHRMTTNLWDLIDVPSAWGNSRLKTLWKGKGRKKDPSKHRGLSIGSTVCKLIIMLILARIRPWYEAQLTDEQNGFRSDRGCTDGIYTAKRIQQITKRKKQVLYLLFVDLTAAFDHIPRKWLFETIKLRFPEGRYPKVFQILEKLYSNTSLTYDEANEIFMTTSGVRQGGPESPPLFNLYIDFVMRVFLVRCSKDSDIKFFSFKYRFNSRAVTREERRKNRENNQALENECILPWCGYADDLILFIIDQTGLQKATCLLNDVFGSFGLKMNISKTESMILNHHELSSVEYPESVV